VVDVLAVVLLVDIDRFATQQQQIVRTEQGGELLSRVRLELQKALRGAFLLQ